MPTVVLEIISIASITVLLIIILIINKKRNAWDIMFYNTTLAIYVLFMIGLIDGNSWPTIIYSLGIVAVGTGIAAVMKNLKNK